VREVVAPDVGFRALADEEGALPATGFVLGKAPADARAARSDQHLPTWRDGTGNVYCGVKKSRKSLLSPKFIHHQAT